MLIPKKTDAQVLTQLRCSFQGPGRPCWYPPTSFPASDSRGSGPIRPLSGLKKGHPPNPIGYHHLSHEISFSGVYQVYHYTVKLFCIISHLPKHPFNYHWRWVKRSINAHGLIVHDTLTANLIQRIHHVQHLIVLPCGDVNDMPWKKLTQADDTWEWNHSKI